jgi:predicted site-specific integrase-resolvase
MATTPLVYSVDDVKEIFQIAESTFWKWAREGRFGTLVRIGRRTYVRGDAVKALVGA